MDPIEALEVEVRKFHDLAVRAWSFTSDDLFHKVVGAIHLLCARIAECEQARVRREEIVRVLAPARAIHRRSPFIQRLQTWPRGYPGDFETIDYLCRGQPILPPGSVEYVCELYSLTCAVAQQHRNKVHRQADLITSIVTARPGARILILGCGSCQDVVHALPSLVGKNFELVLNDYDPGALAAAEHNLMAIYEHIELRGDSILRLLRRPTALDRFDLVLAGGLFDYFSDRHVIFIVNQVYNRLLCNGASFFFTNIVIKNPYRLWMSYLADWHLIERSPEDIHRVAAEAHIDSANLAVETDQTTLTLLARVTRPE